jgi:hypothetical protein
MAAPARAELPSGGGGFVTMEVPVSEGLQGLVLVGGGIDLRGPYCLACAGVTTDTPGGGFVTNVGWKVFRLPGLHDPSEAGNGVYVGRDNGSSELGTFAYFQGGVPVSSGGFITRVFHPLGKRLKLSLGAFAEGAVTAKQAAAAGAVAAVGALGAQALGKKYGKATGHRPWLRPILWTAALVT